jgi:hypothetical protein
MQDTKINGIFFIQPVWLDGKKMQAFLLQIKFNRIFLSTGPFQGRQEKP